MTDFEFIQMGEVLSWKMSSKELREQTLNTYSLLFWS